VIDHAAITAWNLANLRARQEYATRPFINVKHNPCIEPWCWGQRVVGEARCDECHRLLQAAEAGIKKAAKQKRYRDRKRP